MRLLVLAAALVIGAGTAAAEGDLKQDLARSLVQSILVAPGADRQEKEGEDCSGFVRVIGATRYDDGFGGLSSHYYELKLEANLPEPIVGWVANGYSQHVLDDHPKGNALERDIALKDGDTFKALIQDYSRGKERIEDLTFSVEVKKYLKEDGTVVECR
ncbi:hypothetical protein [Pseudovibrio exalbescens]|uniref:hypothetical protein n=1 Tax=Pseudovibrio exalbescens TaxID=197461 RepID=UPI0011AEE1C6|nr:hypothetical protein [Pseudovibrio exalbescens]